MPTLEEYRSIAQSALSSSGAFVRIDRRDALFVSDVLKRPGGLSDEAKASLEAHFSISERLGLICLTPKFETVPVSLRGLALEILKSDKEKAEKAIRTSLAVCMRKKQTEETRYLENLLKGEKSL